jgi:uncharacterized protein (TIGR03083 family)
MTAAHARAYRDVQGRIAGLAGQGHEIPVPATPGWSVQDLVAHVTGLARDWADGRLEGYASAGWTARQVEERAGQTIEAVLEEWSGCLGALDAILAEPENAGLPDPLMTAFGPVAAAAWPDIIVTDVALHEHDIRSALDAPGARKSDAVLLAMRSHVGMLRFVAGAYGLPALLLDPLDGPRSYQIGRDDPALVLRAPLYELFRATGGRRSREQMAALDWSAEPGAWLDHLVMPSYGVPEQDLVE